MECFTVLFDIMEKLKRRNAAKYQIYIILIDLVRSEAIDIDELDLCRIDVLQNVEFYAFSYR